MNEARLKETLYRANDGTLAVLPTYFIYDQLYEVVARAEKSTELRDLERKLTDEWVKEKFPNGAPNVIAFDSYY